MPPRNRNPKPLTGKEKQGQGGGAATSADLAADYGWSLALLNSDPDLRRVFRTAVKQGWAPGRFVAELQDTKWFRKHSATWRQNEIQRIVDPASWKQARNANRATARDTAAAMGAHLTETQLKRLADNAMAFGWNESQMRDQLAGFIKHQPKGQHAGQWTGEAGVAFTQIRQAAVRNGYNIPQGKMDEWLGSIARGDSTVDDYAQMMRRRAGDAYPALRTELLAGADLDDLAAPFRETMSRLLEIPPDQIGLHDNTMRKALSVKSPKGEYSTMPLYDFEDEIRKDDRWQYTDNAKKEIMGEVMRIGRQFGRTG